MFSLIAYVTACTPVICTKFNTLSSTKSPTEYTIRYIRECLLSTESGMSSLYTIRSKIFTIMSIFNTPGSKKIVSTTSIINVIWSKTYRKIRLRWYTSTSHASKFLHIYEPSYTATTLIMPFPTVRRDIVTTTFPAIPLPTHKIFRSRSTHGTICFILLS